ncbi:MAG: tetratricopeptide repeat protein, partial [Chloroflexota bacterium]
MQETPARNAPCPCGSGKKFKNCCIDRHTGQIVAARPMGSFHAQTQRGIDPEAALQAAIGAFQMGDLDGAATLGRRVPTAAAQAMHALNLRGMIAQIQGRFSEALDLCNQAITRDRSIPEFHNNQGNALQALKRHDEAGAAFKTAIRLRPTFAEAHNNLANLRLEQGLAEEALESYKSALRLRPVYFEANLNRGNALSALKRFGEAVPSFREALALRPDSSDALGSLGTALMALSRYEEAVDTYLAAIQSNPLEPEFFCSLGDAFLALSLNDEAITAYNEAVRLRPIFGRALNNLGNALNNAGRGMEAAAAYEKALEINPTQAETHSNLATVYLSVKRDEEALIHYRRAVECDPHYLNAAEGLFQTVRVQCAWDLWAEARDHYHDLVRDLLARGDPLFTSPFNAFSLPLAPLDQRAVVERASASIAAPLAPLRSSLPAAPPRSTTQRLRIGYLSADYRSHATAHLLGHLFRRHDRSRFEVIAYSTGADDGSDYRRRFESEAERFVDMHGWPPMRIASQIRADGVDILVDLHGHTVGSCLPALALHPARLQVHFLGYPGTVGKDLVDYSLVDAMVCPPEHDRYYSEATYRLPDTYHMNEHEEPAPREPREAYGLPERSFVFCCFNAAYKLTPEIFQIWLRILDQVPESVLWLYGESEIVTRNLTGLGARLGCAPERLI